MSRINPYYGQLNQSVYVGDPTKQINLQQANGTTTSSIWNNSAAEGVINVLQLELGNLRTSLETITKENTFLKLRLLKLEGKFTDQEISNIKDMLNSNDEASITVAHEILNNG